MLDMQTVKELNITEGDVRTIHDSSNNLLWGRLAYDIKYAGDTVQDGTPTPDTPVPVQVVTGEQTVEVTGKNLWNPTPILTGYVLNSSGNNYALEGGEIYRTDNVTAGESCTITTTPSRTGNMRIHAYRANDSWVGQIDAVSFTSNTRKSATFTIPNETAYIKWSFLTGMVDSQLEQGSTATAYEPYQGQSYPISLGSIELAKIGNYQDYIYKSGDDWYAHKECGKYTFDGNETFNYQSVYSGFTINTANIGSYMPNAHIPMAGVSDHFIVETTTTTWSGEGKIGLSASGTFWAKSTAFGNSQATCQTWLQTNTPTVYYALATPTDTKITDSTLISQLDAIHQWLTRYGYNATVSGNLPMIIDKTNLT